MGTNLRGGQHGARETGRNRSAVATPICMTQADARKREERIAGRATLGLLGAIAGMTVIALTPEPGHRGVMAGSRS
jgi:hypothetical protein